jgi:type IV pilus assembly protein PilB
MNHQLEDIEVELLQLITAQQAHHFGIIPKYQHNGDITFLIEDTADTSTIKYELEALLGKNISLEKSPAPLIKKALAKHYRKYEKTNQLSGSDFFEELIKEAHAIGCSDIHIESYNERCRVRMRLDGKLMERYSIPKSDYPALVNKIKIRAMLDIAEKRLPQDGRITLKILDLDIRVSILPTHFGEKVVLRLLSKSAKQVDLEQLGFQQEQLAGYLQGIKKTQGLVLISGPTGSGKTTTLYASLKQLNQKDVNILTIEDPIEYTLEGINQVQLKEDIGLDFPKALRTFLRQDPDIVMVGEIRDAETAQMAIRAALTGHLVLSTIHTNSAWGTIARLIDMGIPSFLIADTLNLSVAQRLLRLLCPECKHKEVFQKEMLPAAFSQVTLSHQYKAVGCSQCHYTCYKGRKSIYDVLPIDEKLSESIKDQQWEGKRKNALAESALKLLMQGKTTFEEVYPILLHQE